MNRICLDVTPPVLKLQGDRVVQVEAATSYTDAGATASDTSGQIITVVLNSTLPADLRPRDFVTPSDYLIRYDAKDEAGNAATPLFRTVRIVDTTRPEITLRGGASVFAEASFPYIDAGATAADLLEGNISVRVQVTNPVNVTPPTTPQSFTVRYNVADLAKNSAFEVTRTVTVRDTLPPNIALIGDAEFTLQVWCVKNKLTN